MNVIDKIKGFFRRDASKNFGHPKNFSLAMLREYYSDFQVGTKLVGWSYAAANKIATDISTAQFKSRTPKIFANNLSDFLYIASMQLDFNGYSAWYIASNDTLIPLWGATPLYDLSGKLVGIQNGMNKIPMSNVLFISNINPLTGQTFATIDAVKSAISAEESMAQWTEKLLKNWYVIPFILTSKLDPNKLNALTDEEINLIISKLEDYHKGRIRPMILPEVFSIKELTQIDPGTTISNLPFTQIRDRILGVFGVPASVLGISDRVNRAHAEINFNVYKSNVLEPRLRKIEAAINNQRDKLGITYEIDLVFPESVDPEKQRDAAIKLFSANIITQNEAREMVGFEKIDNGDMLLAEIRFLNKEVVGNVKNEEVKHG